MGFLKKVGKVIGKVAKFAAPLLTGVTTPATLIKSFINERVGRALGEKKPVAQVRTKADGPFVPGTNEQMVNPSRATARSERRGGLSRNRRRFKVVESGTQSTGSV